MRKLLAILLLLAPGIFLSAQIERPRNLPAFDYKRLHWGFTVGLNSMDYAVKRNMNYAGTNPGEYKYADVIGFQPSGFQVNIVSDLRLDDYWNLRFLPGINLGSRDLVFFDPNTWVADPPMTVGSSFLDFPLILKYRSERVNNYRPYVIGGTSYRLDMSAKKQFGGDPGEDPVKILTKRNDFYLEIGFGVDYYSQYFKQSTEIKLAIGLRNIMNNNPEGLYPNEEFYAQSILGLRSYMVMLNFHFE